MTPKVIHPARVDYSQALRRSDLENKFQLNSLKNFKAGERGRERWNKLSLKLTLPDFPTPIQHKKRINWSHMSSGKKQDTMSIINIYHLRGLPEAIRAHQPSEGVFQPFGGKLEQIQGL